MLDCSLLPTYSIHQAYIVSRGIDRKVLVFQMARTPIEIDWIRERVSMHQRLFRGNFEIWVDFELAHAGCSDNRCGTVMLLRLSPRIRC
jgi:hypothetical protein